MMSKTQQTSKPKEKERLQKYIARCGIASRRRAELLISDGKVSVNGKTVTEMGFSVDPSKDRVAVEGKPIHQKRDKTYLLLYKPAGVVSTCDDPRRRRTVLDLLPGGDRLYPVGRLDYETEGLLLLTDDGELTHKLTHPRYAIPKTYLVEVSGLLSRDMAAAMQKGILLEDGMTRPAKVRLEYYSKEGSRFYLTISEGRNRQVRRMCEALGLTVTYLCRTSMGPLDLSGLEAGGYRRLKKHEIRRLKEALPKEG